MWKSIVVVVFVLCLGVAGYCTDYEQARNGAEQLSKAGDRLAAAALLEKTIGTDTGVEAEWLRAYIGVLKKSPDRDVLTQFLKVVDRFPSSERAPMALLRAGYIRDKIGDNAHQDWERLVRDYPHTKAAAEALHGLGHLALREGNPMLAASKFDDSAALSEAPASIVADSVMEAGYAYVSHYWQTRNSDVLPKAIAHFKRLKTDSTDPELSLKAQMGLGEVYLLEGLYDKAIAEYRGVENAHPKDAFMRATAKFEIGCCLYGLKDYSGALGVFDTFVSDSPGSTLKQKDSGWKAARPGYAELADKRADKAAKLCGLDLIPEAICCKPRCLFQLQRYVEADQLAQQVMNEFANADCRQRAKGVRDLCKAMRGR